MAESYTNVTYFIAWAVLSNDLPNLPSTLIPTSSHSVYLLNTHYTPSITLGFTHATSFYLLNTHVRY